METRETERSPKEAANLNGIRRKLRSQRGVTIVFALVIFLIMALFSYVMVNASLTAVQGAGQFDQQAYSSTRSVAFMIRDALKKYPKFTVTDGRWENSSQTSSLLEESSFSYLYIKNQLQNPAPSVWKIKDVPNNENLKKAKEKFGVVEVTITASTVIVGAYPSITVQLQHWDYDKDNPSGYDNTKPSNYKMTVVFTATRLAEVSLSGPNSTDVLFFDSTTGTDIKMTAQQGVS